MCLPCAVVWLSFFRETIQLIARLPGTIFAAAITLCHQYLLQHDKNMLKGSLFLLKRVWIKIVYHPIPKMSNTDALSWWFCPTLYVPFQNLHSVASRLHYRRVLFFLLHSFVHSMFSLIVSFYACSLLELFCVCVYVCVVQGDAFWIICPEDDTANQDIIGTRHATHTLTKISMLEESHTCMCVCVCVQCLPWNWISKAQSAFYFNRYMHVYLSMWPWL